MKRLTYLVIIFAMVYGGYWFVGSSALESGLKTQLDKMATRGWQIDYDTLETRGFPSRFDTTITDISLTSPDGSLSYEAPIVQALALSYQPNQIIAAFPDQQILNLEGMPITIGSEGFRASVVVAANTALSLTSMTAEAPFLALSVVPEQQLQISNLITALREGNGIPNTYDLFLGADDIILPPNVRATFDPEDKQPNALETIKLDASMTLDRPLDRHTLPVWEVDPGRLRGFTLRSLQIQWGDLEITGDGTFAIAADGTPDGTITLHVNDWQGILSLMQSTGVVPSQYQFLAQSMGQTLAQGAKDLALPVTVTNGNLSVGPLPLGIAPKFR